jgi:hypothetical protein
MVALGVLQMNGLSGNSLPLAVSVSEPLLEDSCKRRGKYKHAAEGKRTSREAKRNMPVLPDGRPGHGGKQQENTTMSQKN